MNQNKLLFVSALAVVAFLYTRKAQAASQRATTLTPTRPVVTGVRPANGTAQALGLVGGIIGGVQSLFSGMGRPVSEIGDASSTVGEDAAQRYYNNNRDEFASNPPTSYVAYLDTQGVSDGWLDNR